jgi:uncharacterized membrane protein YkoI
MKFKQFFLERSGARHLSNAAIHSGGMDKLNGSLSLVAASRKKETHKNQKLKTAKNNIGKEVKISSHEAKKMINKNSNGKKVNFDNIGSDGKTLNGKHGVKIKKKNSQFFLEK